MGHIKIALGGLALATVTLTATACASDAGTHRGAAAASGCAPAGSRTVTRNASARVIHLGHTFYGCAERRGRLVALGGDACLGAKQGLVAHARLAGSTVGYALMTCGIDTGNAQVFSVDLVAGMIMRESAANLLPAGPESFATVTDLVVKSDGALAWISRTSSIIGQRAPSIEVDRDDRRGTKTLDHGAGVATGSLKLSGSRVSWTRSGRRLTSSLV